MIYITGDCHGRFGRFMSGGFSCCPDLTENDTVIVCGDLGLLWAKGESFEQDCEFFAKQSFTLLWVQGNHENYNMIDEYPVEKWHGGKVRHIVRDKVILLERGQVFDIEGKRYFTFGGAQSHDISGGVLDKDDPLFEHKYNLAMGSGRPFRILNTSWWKQDGGIVKMDQTMEGKVAVVTGASRGIGKAIAVKLASKGATVVINYNGSRERAEEVKNEVESAGGKAVIIQCNVADFDACKEFIETVIKEQGRIDILVNNAGITKDGLLMKMSEEDFDKVLDTNLKGTFHTIRAALRQMIRQRSGRIINMASVVGVSGNAGQANYAASKAGVIGLTKTAAREVASRGITVNAVAPGFIETDMTEVLPEKIKEASAAQIPLGKFGKAEDVANAVAFLASEDAGYITGQVLHVDGGMVM